MKYSFLLLICFCIGITAYANNVRVVGNVRPSTMPNGDIESIEFTLEWENSWRDVYNYDAVYVVLKYRNRTQTPQVWYPVYLEDDGHVVSPGFSWSMAPGTTAGRNVGIFIYRSNPRNGIARTNVNLKWDFSQTAENGEGKVESSDFFNGRVVIGCIGVEMVYIPRGAFALGDKSNNTLNASLRTFRQKDMYIPEEYDIASTKYLCTTNKIVPGHEPSLAVNHINDLTNSATNAWVGDGNKTQNWRIDFKMLADGTELATGYKKEVRYIAIESIPGYVPSTWTLSAANEDVSGGWHTLYTGTAADWNTSLERTYPPVKAIAINNHAEYRYYQIVIEQKDMPAGKTPVIKSVAMTEQDLSTALDYTFTVDAPEIVLGGRRGLNAEEDGENWTEGILPATYPNGYKAFYVMKYEMSQEQYTGFLQLLPPAAQQARTIGEKLNTLDDRSYVFGSNSASASARNGIVISAWNMTRDTASFACDLNPNDAVSTDGDGMQIACNYLSPEDMLAYASWMGLRPLSEMEYERMSRAAYPYVPSPGERAWGGRTIKALSGLQNAGKSSERFASGNVNSGKVIDGPVRVGSFAAAGTKRGDSGASFWGVMDLSGNLNEIYYNANIAGRGFNAALPANHGNGVLPVDGNANIAGWVKNPAAFAIRGGSFATTDASELNTSYRRYASGYFTTLSTRDSTVTFRLGRTCPDGPALPSILTLENGLTTETGNATDTICAGADYRIVGNEPAGELTVSYIWYKSDNEGQTWEIVKSEYGKDITLYDLENQGRDDGVLREYWFKRKVIRDNSDGVSNLVKLKVVNPEYVISRRRDTLDGYGTGAGISLKTKFPTQFKWYYLSGGKELTAGVTAADSSYYLPKRTDLQSKGEGQLHGTKMISVEMRILNTCVRTEVIPVEVINLLDYSLMKVKNFGTYRAWADGSYAPSAELYRRPVNCPYQYKGETGSGIYRIDPDGRSGPIQPFDVYCDMETDGGGWTVVKINFEEDTPHSGHESSYLIFPNITYNLTEEQIVGLRAVSKTGYQYFSKKCYHSVANDDAYCLWQAYGKNAGGINTGHYYHWPNYTSCNPNDSNWRQADGKVTDINLIPIWKYWGDETGGGGEYAKYTFGDVYFR